MNLERFLFICKYLILYYWKSGFLYHCIFWLLLITMYMKVFEFCLLILYPATILNYFIVWTSFVIYFIYSLTNNLQIEIILLLFQFFFSCLTALISTSSICWIEVSKMGNSCLVSDFRGKPGLLWSLFLLQNEASDVTSQREHLQHAQSHMEWQT